VPYLRSLDIFPDELGPARIRRLQLTSVNGREASLLLDLGGFGISRYTFDQFLFQKARHAGVTFHLDTEVERVAFDNETFSVQTSKGNFIADVVIGSFGKRSKLDVVLNRGFMQKRSPYAGIKYHVRLPSFPDDLISLHNFPGGYCGISRVEKDVVNLCYLTHRDNLKAHGNIRAMEEAVLFRNPFLRDIFLNAEYLFSKPETINEISFETKSPVEQNVLMAGDSAGMITPLCGNGMAMAIHSAKILCEHVLRFCRDTTYTRVVMERDYAAAWNKLFSARLWTGRKIQRLFGGTFASNFAVNLARHVKPVANYLVKKTHGETILP